MLRALLPSIRALSFALFALAPLASADVLVVDAAGGGDFVDVQTAVDAAQGGDTLIVRSGDYAGFVLDGKGLSILAERGGEPFLAGQVTVRNLPVRGTVLLAGLRARAPIDANPDLNNGLFVRDNLGAVRIEDCTFEGAGNVGSATSGGGGRGARIEDSSDVVIARSSLLGGKGLNSYDCCGPGADGGEGLLAAGSLLALFDCDVRGGQGGGSGWGGAGGAGASLPNFGAFAAGTTFTGGAGGYGDDFIFGPGGDGGPGLLVGGGAQAQLRDNVFVGGAGGGSFLGQLGSPGGGLVEAPGSTVIQFPGSARRFSAPGEAWEGGAFLVHVQGEPGDLVWFPGKKRAAFRFAAPVAGVWAIGLPVPMPVEPVGVIPAGGSLTFELNLGDLPAGFEADPRYHQGYVISQAGKAFVGTPVSLVRLACDFSPDCDADLTPDACAIQAGLVLDCNANGVPDGCDLAGGFELDCNANGVPDSCDIAAGTSADCDGNGVPDECQYDCNGNGVPDLCDVLSGTSPDCDGNLVPDECDVDCNGNGVADGCDLLNGTSLDSNGNGVPDECQSPGDVYLVDPNGPPWGGDGSAAKPFDTIRKAILYSVSGNTLRLADGVYTGPDNRNLTFDGRDLTIESANGAAGCTIDCEGLGRAFTLSSGQTLASTLRGLTITNGRSQGSASLTDRGGGILVLANSALSVQDCVLSGNDGHRYGGGMWVAPEAHALIEGCSFRLNTATGGASQGSGGGGLSSFVGQSTGTLVIRDCTFEENSGFQGAGLLSSSGSTTIVDSVFSENNKTPFGFGGGIWHLGTGDLDVLRTVVRDNTGSGGAAGIYSESKGRLHVSHCTITGNQGNSLGGGVGARNFFLPTLVATIEHCLIAGNTAGSGAGVIAIDVPELVVRDCTIVQNSANSGGACYVSDVAAASLENCVLWGNTAGFQAPSLLVDDGVLDVDFCDVEGGLAGAVSGTGGGYAWGAGNLDVDPAFVDPDGPDDDPLTLEDNDWRLGALSPCVDAGDNAAVLADVFDLDGDLDLAEAVPFDLDLAPRFVDDPAVADTGAGSAPLVDMGAYEKP